MPLVLALALRNLTRQRRRTLLTASALVLGIAIMILGRAWTAAMERAVVEPAKNGTLGHLQVFADDAASDEGGSVSFVMPQNSYRLIREPGQLIRRVLAAEPRLQAGLARFMIAGLLSAGDESLEGLLIGIDPRARPSVYPAIELHDGRFFEAGDDPRGVLVNQGVARKLGLKVGDPLVVLGNAADGRLNGVQLQVTGTWVIKGLEAYEWGACFVDLAAVQELMDVGDAAAVLVFRLKEPRASSAPVAASLNALFTRDRIAARAYTWEEMGGPFVGGMLLTRFVADIMDLVMAIIVAAGVLNTALMAVFERTREIGTLRAVGARKSRILGLFLLEALLLGLFSAAGGALVGSGLIALFSRVGIPAFSEAQRYSYGGDYLYPRFEWSYVTAVPAVMVVVCVLAALGPAVMAARRRPADALRYV